MIELSLEQLEAQMTELVRERTEMIRWRQDEIANYLEEIANINRNFDAQAIPLGKQIAKLRGDNQPVKRKLALIPAHHFEGLTEEERAHFQRLRNGRG